MVHPVSQGVNAVYVSFCVAAFFCCVQCSRVEDHTTIRSSTARTTSSQQRAYSRKALDIPPARMSPLSWIPGCVQYRVLQSTQVIECQDIEGIERRDSSAEC